MDLGIHLIGFAHSCVCKQETHILMFQFGQESPFFCHHGVENLKLIHEYLESKNPQNPYLVACFSNPRVWHKKFGIQNSIHGTNKINFYGQKWSKISIQINNFNNNIYKDCHPVFVGELRSPGRGRCTSLWSPIWTVTTRVNTHVRWESDQPNPTSLWMNVRQFFIGQHEN